MIAFFLMATLSVYLADVCVVMGVLQNDETPVALATSCDVDLLDLIGEEEHEEFGQKLATKLLEMSTNQCVWSAMLSSF